MAAATPKTPLKLTKEVSELIKEKIKVRMASEIKPSNKVR